MDLAININVGQVYLTCMSGHHYRPCDNNKPLECNEASQPPHIDKTTNKRLTPFLILPYRVLCVIRTSNLSGCFNCSLALGNQGTEGKSNKNTNISFMHQLGRRIAAVTGERRATDYLFQCCHSTRQCCGGFRHNELGGGQTRCSFFIYNF